MRQTINVITRLQDNGDGGYTMYVYNNEQELLDDHPKSKTWCQDENGNWGDVKVELTQEQKDEIIDGYNDYENGYIGRSTIEVNVNGDNITLAKPLVFHGGQ